MLRCASSLVVAAYAKVRLTPQDSRALPAAFLRSRPKFKAFTTFYEFVKSLPGAQLNEVAPPRHDFTAVSQRRLFLPVGPGMIRNGWISNTVKDLQDHSRL